MRLPCLGSGVPPSPSPKQRNAAFIPMNQSQGPSAVEDGNLCLACEPCNKRKGTQDIAVFLAKKPDLRKSIQAQAKAPLKDATAVNSTRWALFEQLKELGLRYPKLGI